MEGIGGEGMSEGSMMTLMYWDFLPCESSHSSRRMGTGSFVALASMAWLTVRAQVYFLYHSCNPRRATVVSLRGRTMSVSPRESKGV